MSSLFAAMGVAVSGLSAQSQSIGNISDNLANAQTTGYKSIGTSFSSLVTASSTTDNSPGGVSAKPHYQNDVQGTISSTSTITNLAISGSGFFAVTTSAQNSSGELQFTGSTFYTRAGDFTLNQDGYMVNSGNYYLQGYVINNGVVDTSSVSPIQISALLDNPESTTAITYTANLPADAVDYTSSASTINVYDSLGSTHETSITWETTGTANIWIATVIVEDAAGELGTSYRTTFNVTFNTDGTVDLIEPQTAAYYDADGNETGSATLPIASDPTTGRKATVTMSELIFPGATEQTIAIDFGHYDIASGLTQYASTSKTVSVSSIAQDGFGEGSYSSISIDKDGVVSINYTNGSTRKIYQIPVATFNSPDSLQRESGGVYTATLASGTANLHLAGTNGSGTISSSALESSTVDIASEFTTMIQSQQVYSANAKVVSTVNSMLDTIIQAAR